MIKNYKFILPEEFDPQQLIDSLTDDYVLKEEASITDSLIFYDTFDWRLYNQSLILYQVGEQLCLHKLFDQENICQVAIEDQPVFAWDLPESELKAQLAPAIEMRALFSLTNLWLGSTSYRVLNAAEKTVVLLTYEELWTSPDQNGPALAAYIQVKPVRGYPKHAKQVGRHLQQLGSSPGKQEEIYFKALGIAGKSPGDYSSKLELKLDPDTRADEASKVILRFLMGVIKTNEPFVIQDIDTEFLHDFRVAVRRTRSILSQVTGVFPDDTTRRFKRDLAYVGRLTNQLRDLDVYLLAESAFQVRFPAEMHDDLDPLFAYLRTQRNLALKEVVAGFESDTYTRILNEWQTFLNEPVPPKPTAAGADQPIINLARKRIYKRYKRVIKDGTYILDHTQDQLLHDLRIEVKKLRYLMEFFASLFPEKTTTKLIKQLKRLHNNLGDFNDLFVQQQYLAHIAEELPIRDHQSRKAIAATGYLIKTLANEQEAVKANFAQIFTDFASPANRKLFRQLFATRKERKNS